jgi:N-acetylmuramoyl-L-alanine amidase CwlA
MLAGRSPQVRRVLDQILNSEDEDIFIEKGVNTSTQTEEGVERTEVQALKEVIDKQYELTKQLAAKTNKCYDMVCSVRREQDRQRSVSYRGGEIDQIERNKESLKKAKQDKIKNIAGSDY